MNRITNHTTALRRACWSFALVLGLSGQALAQEPSEALLEPTRQHPEAEDAIDKLLRVHHVPGPASLLIATSAPSSLSPSVLANQSSAS